MPKAKTEDSLSIQKETAGAEESRDASPQTYTWLPPLPPSPVNTELSDFPELLPSISFYAFDQKAAALQQQEVHLRTQRMELAQREAQTRKWDAELQHWARDQEQRINERWHNLGLWTEHLTRRESRIVDDTADLTKQKTELLLATKNLTDKNAELDKKITLLSNTIKLIQEGGTEGDKRKRDDEAPSVQYTTRARFLSPPVPHAFPVPAENRNPPQTVCYNFSGPQGSKIP